MRQKNFAKTNNLQPLSGTNAIRQMNISPPDIPQLTGIRAIAATMVMLQHLDQNNGNVLLHYFSPIADGYLGVDIFFVLSGFILSHVYGHSAGSNAQAYRRFLWRRLARIYPMHFATLAFMIVAFGRHEPWNAGSAVTILRHLFLLQAWSAELSWNVPSWSIGAEWAAYLVFPAVAAIVLAPRHAAAGTVLAVSLLAAFHVAGVDGGSWTGWPAALRIATEFTLGVLMFRAAQRIRPSLLSDILACGAFCAIFVLPVQALKIAAIAVMIPAVATSAGTARWLLSSASLLILGAASYSLYMIHFPLIKIIQRINFYLGLENHGEVVTIALTVFWAAALMVLAVVAYRLIERPARDWCRRQESTLFRARRLSSTSAE